jgi:nrdI protein
LGVLIVQIVYFSSTSENTHRFVQKLTCVSHRIPLNLQEHMVVDSEYILICPTYSGGGKNTHGHVDTRGAVPKQVIHFLNDEHNRKLCRAVIGTGNTNFGDSFALAGPIIAAKVGVPLAYQFELSGTQEDVTRVQMLIDEKISQPDKAPMLV